MPSRIHGVLIGITWCQDVSNTTGEETTFTSTTATVTDFVDLTEPPSTPSVELLTAVQEELDQACCFILNIDCELVFSVTESLKRKKRRRKRHTGGEGLYHQEEENIIRKTHRAFSDRPSSFQHLYYSPQNISWSSLKLTEKEEDKENTLIGHGYPHASNISVGHRHRREVNLSDRFVDQLGINLLRFETCLCQAVTAPSTCRMLYPPNFYQPSTPQMFSTIFQEKDGVKRMACSFYSGSVVDCTFESSAAYDQNLTSEVTQIMMAQQAASLADCVACTPLSCTFDVFKRRLQPTDTTFNEDYNKCFDDVTAARLEVMPSTTPIVTSTTPISVPPTSPFPSTSPPSHTGQTLTAADFYQEISFTIFPIISIRESIFPMLSRQGIFLGIGRLGGNTTMTELYGLRATGSSLANPFRNDDDHEHGKAGHDDHHALASQMPVIIGAIVGGVLAGALFTVLLIFVLYKNRLVVRRTKQGRSLRDMPIVKLDSDSLTPLPEFMSAEMQPPVARVPPMMTLSPRRPSDLGFSSLSSRASSMPCSPRLSTDSQLQGFTASSAATAARFSVPNPYLIEGEDGEEESYLGNHYNFSYEDTEQLSTGIYSSVDDEQVDMENRHDTVITSTSTTPLTISKELDLSSSGSGAHASNADWFKGQGSKGAAGGKVPRPSRVPEVPSVFIAPAPRRKNKEKRGSSKSNSSALSSSNNKNNNLQSGRTRPRHLHKALSIAPSLQPTANIASADTFPQAFPVDPSSHYEIPVVPKGKRTQRGPAGPPSMPPPPIPPIPPAVKESVLAVPPISPKPVLPPVPPLPKMRGVGKKVPPVPPVRSHVPRNSRSSEVSTLSSRCDSEWSHCAQWDIEELESDFSDMENEYMEIKADPSDIQKTEDKNGEMPYSKIN
ncbi:hypothetical protein PoB_005565700 [Plakobranchus ocellatus]|uniref:Uncharacterized protein n=1 Tax=Plakobranchus ocellatus TaxID=259542 RepID=A0AAV4CCU1_9GAST|nr:hypothetical protein PoB_005565700 [Plakobranchus ocellatus]